MSFGHAVDEFREFLRRQGHVGPLAWIVPTDVAFWFGELMIRPRSDGEIHAEQVFNRAVQLGFGVSIEAIAKLDHSICCFVFAPDDAHDASSHFVAPPLTMKVRQDLKTAFDPGPALWSLATSVVSKHARCRAMQFFGYELDRRAKTANV
jgi:hypothetical protein